METQTFTLSPLIDPSKNKDSEVVRQHFRKYLYRWPWFLTSILLALIAAFFFLRFYPPIYESKARLLIEDEKKTPNKEAALKEMDLFESKKVVENEIEILKSRRLILQVIDDLNLTVDYRVAENGITENLYGTSPIAVEFLNPSDEHIIENYEIAIISKDSFILRRPNGEVLTAPFAGILRNRLRTWRIKATKHLPNYIGKTIKVSILSQNSVAEAYEKKLNVQLVNKLSSVVELTMRDTSPSRARAFLNQLTKAYTTAARDKKSVVAESTLNFINNRLATLGTELNQAEKNVEGYRSSEGLTDISSESEVYLANVQESDKKLNEVSVQLRALQNVEDYINSPMTEGNAPATVGISDPTLIDLINRLIKLQLERENLLATTPEGNPVFEPVNRQLKVTRAAIREIIQGIRSTLLTTKNQLEQYNNAFSASIKKLPGQERQLIDKKRQQSIKESLYVYLLQKREEISFSYASNLIENPAVDAAFVGEPVFPMPAVIYGIAFILGFLLPAGVVVGSDFIQQKVSSPAEIERRTGSSVLSEIGHSNTALPALFDAAAANLITEQFRFLRTNLKYLHGSHNQGRVTLITSSLPGEGKSFVTTNLAISLAASGRKTVILELDLRKPKILSILNIPTDHPGTSEYLIGKAAAAEIVQQSAIPNLSIIGCRLASQQLNELVDNTRLTALLDYLRKKYDDILIDTPPVRLVADAMIVQELSDVLLYVLRQGYSSKLEFQFIKQLQERSKEKPLNLILNGVNMKGKFGYGYVPSSSWNYYSNSKV